MTSRWSRAAVVLSLVPAVMQTPSFAASATCASGRGVRVSPVRVRHDAAGGTFYDYVVGGVDLTSAEAPPGLDLATAPAEQLDRYGLPPRPADGTLDGWVRAMRAYRSAGPDADHDLCLRPDLSETACTGSCGNYAGRWGTLGGYTAVYGNVVVPNMSTSNNCGSYGHTSSWVGIGPEVGSVGLLQAGTITALYPNLNSLVTYGFYEWFAPPGSGNPSTPAVTSSWNADPGDEIYQRVQVNTSSHGVNFYVENLATGDHLTVTAAGIYADYDPDSAGWVVENHTRNDESNVKTSTWAWTGAKVTRYSTTTYGGSTQSPAAASGAELWKDSPYYGQIVENTHAWSSTSSFDTVWYACR